MTAYDRLRSDALDALVTHVKADRSILAAILCGSLSHDVVWEKSDIDLILGDHVHVVQPMERYKGKYVIYGMGNFLSNQSPSQDATLVADNEDGTTTYPEIQNGR
mgnify:CR=1 FL=1